VVTVFLALVIAGSRFGWGPTLNTTIFLTVPLAFIGLTLLLRPHRSDVLERASKWASLAAFVAAAAYFGFQIASGQLSNNLSIAITLQRSSCGAQDLLAFTTTLKHEHAAALKLTDAVAYVTVQDKTETIELLDTFYRHRVVNGTLLNEREVSGSRPERPVMNPGDELQLAGFARISSDRPALVKVVILGKPYTGGVSEQWIATAVSLPTSLQSNP